MLKKNIFVIFWGCIFLKSLIFSLLTPPLEFPDEQAHFATVQYLAESKKMPQEGINDLSNELRITEQYLGTYRDKFGNNRFTYHPQYRTEYSGNLTGKYENDLNLLNTPRNRTTYQSLEAARYPILYYLYSSVIYLLVYPSSIIMRLFTLRLGSILLSTLTVYFIYLLGEEIFRKRKYAITVAVLAAFQPMFSFVGAGINSDNLHNLLFTILLYLLVKFLRQGWRERIALEIGLILGLDLLTKPQAYIMFPILITALILRGFKEKGLVGYVRPLISILITVFIIAGWQEIPKFLHGFSQGTLINLEIGNHTTIPMQFIPFLKFSINKLYAQNIIWYWGVFKWLGVVLPKPLWWLTNRLLMVSFIGLIIYLFKALKRSKNLLADPPVTLFLILSSLIYVILIFIYDWQFAKSYGFSLGIQGRYYFPLISAHLTLIIIGILSFTWSEKLKEILRIGLILFFLILQIGGIITLAMSYYNLSSIPVFIIQVSQYKPWFTKGVWWYFWIASYFVSLIILTMTSIIADENQEKVKKVKSH